jgi:hypothetical protein
MQAGRLFKATNPAKNRRFVDTLALMPLQLPQPSEKANPLQMSHFGARSLPRLPGQCRFGLGYAPESRPGGGCEEEQVWMTS